MKICPQCGITTDDNANWCPTCGQPFPQIAPRYQPRVQPPAESFVSCPHCGSANQSGSIECQFCGLRIAVPKQKTPKAARQRIDTPNPTQIPRRSLNIKERLISFREALKEASLIGLNIVLWALFCPVMLTLSLNKKKAPAWQHFLSFLVYIIWAFIWLIAIIGTIIESGR